MRRSLIALTCGFLAAALLCPGMAMAKGGNGSHAEAAQSSSKASPAKTRKSADKPAAAGQKGRAQAAKTSTAKSPAKKSSSNDSGSSQTSTQDAAQSASPQVTPEAQGAEGPGEADVTAANLPSVPTRQPSTAASYSKLAADVYPSTSLSEDPPSSDVMEASEVETRGVLDTIRVKAGQSLHGVRVFAREMWSALVGWLGA
jgi:hypothetical protein